MSTQKNTPLQNWKQQVADFYTLTEAQAQLQELFNVYLQSEDANCNHNRNKKLFLTNKLQELLTLLNQN